MENRPYASIVVPHYNDLDRLATCLEALDRQSYPRDKYEIVIADNQSLCGIDAVKNVAAGRARVISAIHRGAGPARNEGVCAAQGQAIAFTDADCVPHTNWLANGLRAMSDSDLVGGKVTVLVRDELDLSSTEAFERVFAFNNKRYVLEERFSVTANLFCKREHFAAIGEFRTGVSEDKDWCLRAHAAGLKITYAEDAVVGHPARENFTQLKRKWHRINRESYGLMKPGLAGVMYWIIRTWLLLPSIPIHGFKIMRTRRLQSASQRLGALSTLVLIRLWRFFDCHRILIQRQE